MRPIKYGSFKKWHARPWNWYEEHPSAPDECELRVEKINKSRNIANKSLNEKWGRLNKNSKFGWRSKNLNKFLLFKDHCVTVIKMLKCWKHTNARINNGITTKRLLLDYFILFFVPRPEFFARVSTVHKQTFLYAIRIRLCCVLFWLSRIYDAVVSCYYRKWFINSFSVGAFVLLFWAINEAKVLKNSIFFSSFAVILNKSTAIAYVAASAADIVAVIVVAICLKLNY